MAFLRKLLLVLAILIGVLFVVSFFLPKEAVMERSIGINVKQERLFNYLNNMKNFNEWSPWFEMDPDGKYEFSGAESGVGSKFSWEGENTGIGSQEIVSTNPNSEINLSLVFDGQPPATASYHLATENDQTTMTWKFKTDLNGPMEKYMGLMMDKFIGGTFEKGLQNLKAKAEAWPEEVVAVVEENPMPSTDPEIVTVDAQNLMVVANRADFDGAKISAALAESYGKIIPFMAEKQLNFAGPPMAITTGGSPEEGFWAFEAAIPVDIPLETEEASEIQFKTSYAGKVVKMAHIGAYMSMPASYEKVAAYIEEHGYEINGNVWEQYISDPSVTPENELITYIYFPIK